MGRPPQDVEVLAVLDFQILCFRPETPGSYCICLSTKAIVHGSKTRMFAMTIRTGMRDLKIQDGDVLSSPDHRKHSLSVDGYWKSYFFTGNILFDRPEITPGPWSQLIR